METRFLNSGKIVTNHSRHHECLPHDMLNSCRRIAEGNDSSPFTYGHWQIKLHRVGDIANCRILKSGRILVEFVVVPTGLRRDIWLQFVQLFRGHCLAGRAEQWGPIPPPPTAAPWFALIIHCAINPLPKSELNGLAAFYGCLAQALIEQATGRHPASRN